MTGVERRQAIAAILKKRSSIRVSEMADRLDVSEVTLRKDLAVLEEMGLLQRTHGGAVLAEQAEENAVLSARRELRRESKNAIARAARGLINHGETIFIDSGSTCAALAEAVAEMDLRVVTNSLDVLVILAGKSGIALHAAGGSYRHNGGSFIGPEAEEVISRMQFDHAFLGVTGVSEEGRFSSQNSIEAQFKRQAIAAARNVVVLADADKIGKHAFSVFAGLEEVDILVTDSESPLLSGFREKGLDVIVAENQAL
ncbi:MAG: DeoR/GlpR family DNA-binding transcription regulator [Alkalispirochaetaceae bacterium]